MKIDPDIPLGLACLAGCGVTTGIGAALNVAQVQIDSTVAVIGCGGVGLSAIQGARITGAGKIIAVDAQPWKFDLARDCGATDCVDASEGRSVRPVRPSGRPRVRPRAIRRG